MKHICIF